MRKITTGVQGGPVLGTFTARENNLQTIENNIDIVLDPNGTKEAADLAGPRHRGKLINRRDHEARQPAVDWLVHRNDRQRIATAEVTIPVRTPDR